jgi:hypothetical protein
VVAKRLRPVKEQTLEQAARSGDQRALLMALRDVIASRISDGCAARDLASLSRQLVSIVAELETIDQRARQAADEETGADEAWHPYTVV